VLAGRLVNRQSVTSRSTDRASLPDADAMLPPAPDLMGRKRLLESDGEAFSGIANTVQGPARASN
jgi:hypothetical protein